MIAEYVMYGFIAVCILAGIGAIIYAVKHNPNNHQH